LNSAGIARLWTLPKVPNEKRGEEARGSFMFVVLKKREGEKGTVKREERWRIYCLL